MIQNKKKKNMEKGNLSANIMNALTVMITLGLIGFFAYSSTSILANDQAFGKSPEKTILVSQALSTPSQLTSPKGLVPSSQLEAPSGFVAKGTINSLIDVPNGAWIAVGNWSMTLNNGEITLFMTNMTWHDSNGTKAHTHELAGLSPLIGEPVLSVQQPSTNNILLMGVTDVGTNNRISWTDVPATISINGRKIISISVDDNMTNHHFAAQPVFGIVSSFVPCSDLPGPNMEVLSPCSVESTQASFAPSTSIPATEEFVPSPNATSAQGLTGSEDALGTEGSAASGGGPATTESEDAPGLSEDAPGLSEDAPGIEQSEHAPGIKSSLTPSAQADQQDTSVGALAKATSPEGEEVITSTSTSKASQQCQEIGIMNVTSNGFETDPADYHPAIDATDGNSSTWWSNQGENSWLKMDLGLQASLCEVSVEWNKGDERKYNFEIAASEDGNDFKQVFEGTNQEGSSAVESYKIDDASGRYLILTVTGSSSDKGWVSIKEIGVTGTPLA